MRIGPNGEIHWTPMPVETRISWLVSTDASAIALRLDAPERSDIDERLAEKAHFLGDERQRIGKFRRARVVELAAQRVGRVGVARTDTADGEAAHRVATDEEQVVQADIGAVEGEDQAAPNRRPTSTTSSNRDL